MKTGVAIGLDPEGLKIQVAFQPDPPSIEIGAVYVNLNRVEAQKLRNQLTDALIKVDN